MVEGAEELVEAMRCRQMLVQVAEMVLAELAGHIAVRLEQFGKRRIFGLHAFLGTRQADLQQPRAVGRLPGDESGATGRAALLAVVVREQAALSGDPVDVGRLVTHHALVVGADVPVADVVAPQDQDVRGPGIRLGPGQGARTDRSQAGCAEERDTAEQQVATPHGHAFLWATAEVSLHFTGHRSLLFSTSVKGQSGPASRDEVPIPRIVPPVTQGHYSESAVASQKPQKMQKVRSAEQFGLVSTAARPSARQPPQRLAVPARSEPLHLPHAGSPPPRRPANSLDGRERLPHAPSV